MRDNNRAHIASWNAGAERFKGYAAHEVNGRHFSIFYTNEDIQSGIPATALQTSERTGKFEAEGWRVLQGLSRLLAPQKGGPLGIRFPTL